MDIGDISIIVNPIRNIDYFVIGLFIVSCYVGNLGQYSIMSQYIYHRISLDKHFVRDINASQCFHTNSTSWETQNEIQSSAARYNIYAQLSCGIPSIIAVIFCGSFSDLFGRKLVILISWVFIFLGTIINILLIGFDGPLWVYVFGQFISGLGGNYGATLMGVFALISDSTGHHNRNYGIIMIELALGISMIASQSLLGRWLRFNAFFWPILSFGFLFSCSGIVWLFLRETRTKSATKVHSIKNYALVSVHKMMRIFILSGKCNVLLVLCTISFFIHTFNFFGNLTLITVYLFGEPFCWDSETLGYYRSIATAIVQLGIFLSFLLLKLKLDEIFIVELGFFTNISAKFLFAIAPLFRKVVCDYLIYCASFDLFSGASVSLLRSISSKLVSSDEYGTLFGMMSSVETLGSLFGGVIFNAIYDVSFGFYYGFCYLISSLLLFVAFVLMIIFYVRRNIEKLQYERMES